MMFQLVKMAPCDFIDSVFDPYRSQLAKFWPDEKIVLIERHQHKLFNAYKREPGSKLLVDKHDHTTFFNTGWDDMKGALSICKCSTVDWQMLSPTQQALSRILTL